MLGAERAARIRRAWIGMCLSSSLWKGDYLARASLM
jgi:hypothetical protein